MFWIRPPALQLGFTMTTFVLLRETAQNGHYNLFPKIIIILVKFGVTPLNWPGRRLVGTAAFYDLQYLSTWHVSE